MSREVAERVGYSPASTFSVAFTRYVGCRLCGLRAVLDCPRGDRENSGVPMDVHMPGPCNSVSATSRKTGIHSDPSLVLSSASWARLFAMWKPVTKGKLGNT